MERPQTTAVRWNGCWRRGNSGDAGRCLPSRPTSVCRARYRFWRASLAERVRRASITIFEVLNPLATSGSRTTTFDPLESLSQSLPRTPLASNPEMRTTCRKGSADDEGAAEDLRYFPQRSGSSCLLSDSKLHRDFPQDGVERHRSLEQRIRWQPTATENDSNCLNSYISAMVRVCDLKLVLLIHGMPIHHDPSPVRELYLKRGEGVGL